MGKRYIGEAYIIDGRQSTREDHRTYYILRCVRDPPFSHDKYIYIYIIVHLFSCLFVLIFFYHVTGT